MIHDARIEVTCDGCNGAGVEYDVPYTYMSLNGGGGAYRADDEKIEEWLVDECDWIVKDGKHYCCESCVPKPAKTARKTKAEARQ